MEGYRILDKIKDGGYSSVYKCVQTGCKGQLLACKVIPKLRCIHKMVEREINIMERMSICERVVKFVEAREDSLSYYIVQEYIHGGEIQDPMYNGNCYTEKDAAKIAKSVVEGLYCIHESGIIHRDIKPGNILLTREGNTKIIDFGISIDYNIDADETKSDMVGTPCFMAPETLRSLYVPKSDIWSLGIVLFLLLNKKLPFNDKKYPTNPRLSVIWRSILQDECVWNELESSSKNAMDFVNMCLHKDHRKRPSAMECLNHPWLA